MRFVTPCQPPAALDVCEFAFSIFVCLKDLSLLRRVTMEGVRRIITMNITVFSGVSAGICDF